MMQSLTMSAFFAFLVLADRSKFGFLPRKDCKHFIDKVESLHVKTNSHITPVAMTPSVVPDVNIQASTGEIAGTPATGAS